MSERICCCLNCEDEAFLVCVEHSVNSVLNAIPAIDTS